MNNMECKFCNKVVQDHDGFYICNRCKTVCFTGKVPPDKIPKLIKEYLSNIQDKLSFSSSYLYMIIQKEVLGEQLSAAEQEIYKKLFEFNDVRLCLEEIYLKNGSSLDGKKERQLLYKLLMLSTWLNNLLNN